VGSRLQLSLPVAIKLYEENGILVNPNSGCEIFQAFSRLCQDQQLREKLGRIGKELAKRKTLHRTLYASRVSP